MFNRRKIVLCSASPRRQFLLRGIGIDFEVRTKDVDESFPLYLSGKSIALFVAEKKANEYLNNLLPDEIFITADTIVWVNEKVLNKPLTKKEAVEMLSELSGKRHKVFTGICIANINKKYLFYVMSEVYFRALSAAEINHYVDNFNPLDKAGAYGAQECLPVGINPCSREEMKFLAGINKMELIEQSINRTKDKESVDMIEKIDGSFFNVMGFPVKEVYESLQKFQPVA